MSVISNLITIMHKAQYCIDNTSGKPLVVREEVEAIEREYDALREAARAVVDRWHTPNWKDAEATGAVINRLERALEGKG